ncbi:leucyl/phenylalanyl-tRNA--protein transferase [Parvibaculum sp.]|uniref:leucyl/phenylalanyl-tRNA--protein transferase n=1 Tax=Parvibaculum sp. TaxID=2024848 RepID=UPI00273036E2|nr:leucyl/phenylalanyl-tRNA--protein transferase [Parvibaculum sp.]MDP1627841.1 leucyl/phenylalanyl-tRNA--protein transferase [Parvibaculum sp.]MDP2150839.1 leucyl/phenylalanyl-tRNA--protein transferase [Parvibaculum sp.]MDP3327616.1 leucyl/phenylalanyl-tRNA--protein transferase [Parvibaculum sp.]
MSNIDSDVLLRAYAYGVFPMAESRDDPQLYWIDPDARGILPLDAFHVPRRLRRTVRQQPFEVRIDTAFRDVMLGCAEGGPNRNGTWINDRILALYCELHERGRAHSVECWREGRLVGGLYGVSLGAAFFGESMFSRETDASKVALVYLVARLIAGGYRLLDTQFVTSHLQQFGAVEISRNAYRAKLFEATAMTANFYSLPLDAPPDAVLQSVTQMS